MNICALEERSLSEYPGHVACTIYTDGCNFKCPYCSHKSIRDGVAKPVISEEDFFKFLDKAAEEKSLDSVVIKGGEPTLHKELPDLIRHIKGYYGFKVKICTNSSNITMIDEFLCEGMIDYIAMDIKAGHSGYAKLAGTEIDEGVIASIRGCLDLFEGKFEGLPLFPYEFRTTVVGGLHTDEDFREIGELIDGIKRYVLVPYKPCGEECAETKGLYTPSMKELLRYKEIIAPHVETVEIRT